MMKRTPISTLPVEELAEMWDIAWTLKWAKRQAPDKYAWKIETLEEDMKELFQAMEHKVPISHTWEVEKIKKGLTSPRHNIKPGFMYHHLLIPKLTIQVIEQDEFTNLWTCHQFVGDHFASRVHLRTISIVENYQRIVE